MRFQANFICLQALAILALALPSLAAPACAGDLEFPTRTLTNVSESADAIGPRSTVPSCDKAAWSSDPNHPQFCKWKAQVWWEWYLVMSFFEIDIWEDKGFPPDTTCGLHVFERVRAIWAYPSGFHCSWRHHPRRIRIKFYTFGRYHLEQCMRAVEDSSRGTINILEIKRVTRDDKVRGRVFWWNKDGWAHFEGTGGKGKDGPVDLG